MEQLTMENLRAACYFLLGLAAVLVSIDKGIDAWKHLRGTDEKAKKERTANDHMSNLDTRITACEKRLKEGDEKFDAYSKDTGMMLNVLNVMLMHMITGNSAEKLKEIKSSLDAYMAQRR